MIVMDTMKPCGRTCLEYQQLMPEAISDAVCRKTIQLAISATASLKSCGMSWFPA